MGRTTSTEGQIFQSAAGWCLRNNQSEREAEVEFHRVFQNVIHYEVLTSADFIQNLLPNSNILEREVLKKITKLCFESESSCIFTIHTQQLVKSVLTIFPQKDLHQILKKTSQHSFVKFQVEIQSDFYPRQKKIECELNF